ncbi:uncharacterized protein LOC111622342 [Centruroides sculpturatus]|uniref:uncharacterized protein LOC111622342 n=1 Tax=Centruroides sculpturatus TaxID=218467 RepID=UPI000C6E4237|nr:uncharacterized protein LOC111622342 [Centruroides sculpturatus]
MGSLIAGDLCELVIRLLEQKVLPDLLHNIITYKRYVDDIIILWKSKPDIMAVIAAFNNNSYGLTVGLEQESNKQIHFLDVNIIVKERSINTEVYRKPQADQLYIPAHSCDPWQYKIAAFNNLVNRAYTHSSTLRALDTEINTINIMAKRHGYNSSIAMRIKKLMHSRRTDLTEPQGQQSNIQKDRILVTYNPYLEKIYKEIAKTKQASLIFRRCPTIFRMLNNAKDTPHQNKLAGVYRIPIKDHRCDKSLVYVGSTKRPLEVRIKEHKADILHKRYSTALAQFATDPDIQAVFDEAKVIYTTQLIQHLRWMEAIYIYKTAREDNCINNKDELSLSMAWQTLIYDT